MTTTITRDILTIDKGIIIHQVNLKAVMGAGMAKKIADKWPVVKEDYRLSFELKYPDQPSFNLPPAPPELGDYIRTEVQPNLFVVSVFGQEHYGRGRCYTSYRALANAFSELQKSNTDLEFSSQPLPIYLPHGIGCGAGGDWHVVSAIIEQELPDAVICRCPDPLTAPLPQSLVQR